MQDGMQDGTPRLWEIWCEGYAATGERGYHQKLGEARGRTFREACAEFMSQSEYVRYYNPEYNTYWGCKLFDNPRDAARAFG